MPSAENRAITPVGISAKSVSGQKICGTQGIETSNLGKTSLRRNAPRSCVELKKNWKQTRKPNGTQQLLTVSSSGYSKSGERGELRFCSFNLVLRVFMANRRSCDYKLAKHKAPCHFDTWPDVCQDLLQAAILNTEKTLGTGLLLVHIIYGALSDCVVLPYSLTLTVQQLL